MDLPLATEERSDILSIEKFITDMLNIDPNTIESIESVSGSDDSEDILLKLKPSKKEDMSVLRPSSYQ